MAEKSEGKGCLRIGLLVLGIGFILTVGCSYLVYKGSGFLVRKNSAWGVDQYSKGIMANLPYDQASEAALKRPFDEYSKKIMAGDISVEQGVVFLATVADSPLVVLSFVEKLIVVQIPSSGLDSTQKDLVKRSLQQFGEAVQTGAIETKTATDVIEGSLTDPGRPVRGIIASQSQLSDRVILGIAERTQKAAEEAGIQAGEYKIDFDKIVKEFFSDEKLYNEFWDKHPEQRIRWVQ